MKLLLSLAIVLSATSAFATRARVQALGNAAHLVDSSTVYMKPADIFAVSDSVTIESGLTATTPATGTTSASGTEALVIRSMGDAKWALSLGHDDETVLAQRAGANSIAGFTGGVSQQNPFELTYGMKAGDLAWAATLAYSNFNNKVAESKESTTNVKFGAATSSWDASVDLGVMSKTESGTGTTKDEFKGKSNVAVRGGYWVSSDMYTYGEVVNGGFEVTNGPAAAVEVKNQAIKIGAINTMKNDGNEFFWGAAIESTQVKVDDAKDTSLSLPFIIGLEANAASWLTLRGSITQNVLIQNEKSDNGTATTAELAPGLNSTAFAAGAGLKLGKLSLDGSLLANNTQTVNSANLLGTVGLTYAF
ncbi:hypothetical protein CIK05_02360 [Bdellovibrio sp. qaytius]|nr:hypothetical protein CIK05_02360 [Bdellovibrio sp. qaytius]